MTPEQIAELIGVLRAADHQEDWKASSDAQGRIIGEFAKLLDAADKLARLTALLEPLRPLEAKATKAPWDYGRHATIYRVNEEGRAVQLVIETGSPDGGDTEPYWQGKDADVDLLLAARNALAEMLRVVGL